MKRSWQCACALGVVLMAQGASFSGNDLSSGMERLSVHPMITTEVAVATIEPTGARLAGLAVTLPTVSAENLGALAGLGGEFLKALEKVEMPSGAMAASGFTLFDRNIPLPTLLAFGAGAVLLVALVVFAVALLKMSMDDTRKVRRMRRRYAP